MVTDRACYAVTGATGYSGKYIAQRLLAQGHDVLNLTGHPNRPNPFGSRVESVRFDFADHGAMARLLEGVTTLINTYWIRFPRGGLTHERAVGNSRALFRAAADAGVERVVRVSITNPSADSDLSYFRGKAQVERALRESGLSYAILRPAVLFGGEPGEDILINNVAWLLRRFPAFAVPGDGGYRLQPIHVEDMAALAVAQGQQYEDVVIDAIGPETFRFVDLVRLIKHAVGSRALIAYTPPALALWLSRAISLLAGDVMLTHDELVGLMRDLLVTDSLPAGETKLSQWLAENAATLGVTYASEVARHYD